MCMDLKDLTQKAREVKEAYAVLNKKKGQNSWGVSEYTQGFVGDDGDLVKLVMAKENYRGNKENIDNQIAHELSDCLWSILIIADELKINIEPEFLKTMEELKLKILNNG